MKNKFSSLSVGKKESLQDVLKILVVTWILGVLLKAIFFKVIMYLVLKMNFL